MMAAVLQNIALQWFFVTVAVLQEYRVSALTLLVGCQEEYLALKN